MHTVNTNAQKGIACRSQRRQHVNWETGEEIWWHRRVTVGARSETRRAEGKRRATRSPRGKQRLSRHVEMSSSDSPSRPLAVPMGENICNGWNERGRGGEASSEARARARTNDGLEHIAGLRGELSDGHGDGAREPGRPNAPRRRVCAHQHIVLFSPRRSDSAPES